MFKRLVYVSRAAPGIAARDPYDIIRVSHNRNCQYGLTGALLFLDGYFVQVLEGDRFWVQERFEAISRDPRHTHIEVRQSSTSDTLVFPGEWMAPRNENDITEETRNAFGYAPGLPAGRFDGDRVVEFVLACYRQRAAELSPTLV